MVLIRGGEIPGEGGQSTEKACGLLTMVRHCHMQGEYSGPGDLLDDCWKDIIPERGVSG